MLAKRKFDFNLVFYQAWLLYLHVGIRSNECINFTFDSTALLRSDHYGGVPIVVDAFRKHLLDGSNTFLDRVFIYSDEFKSKPNRP